MRRILVTRPLPAAERTAATLVAMGHRPILAPMLSVQPLTVALPGALGLQAVLVTSANALPALPPALHATMLLAVGDATAAGARQAGFRHVLSAARDAAALAALTIATCVPPGRLLLASGADQGGPLASTLRHAGFTVDHRHVYAAQPATTMPADARQALTTGSLSDAMFFSPATAANFVALISTLPKPDIRATEALAISDATAAPLTCLPWRRIRVALHPNQEELLALLA